MDDQQFEMMMQMHRDTQELIGGVKGDVEQFTRSVTSKLDDHIKDDIEVHKVVDRHTTYWKVFSGGLTSVLTYFGIIK